MRDKHIISRFSYDYKTKDLYLEGKNTLFFDSIKHAIILLVKEFKCYSIAHIFNVR